MASLRLWSPMDQMFQELGNMSKFLEVPNVPVLFKGGEPKVDIMQTDKDVIVMADVPGVKKEDIHVVVDGNQVSISAETRHEKEIKEGERVLRSERYFGKVSRSFQLGQEIDDAKATAKFNDGVLELTLPKRAASPNKRLTVE